MLAKYANSCTKVALFPGPFTPFLMSGKVPGNIRNQNCCKLLQEKVRHQSDCTIFCACDKTSYWQVMHHGVSLTEP